MQRLRVLRSLLVCGAIAGASSPVRAAPEKAKAPDAKADAKAEDKTADKADADPAPAAGGEDARTYEGSALGVDLKVRSFTLDNGLKVYVLEDHSTPAFATQIMVNVGSRDEPEGKTGFAHFFEHMMFKGSENVPEGGHFKHILEVGGQLNAFTTADFTGYFSVLPSHYLDRALWLEADRFASLEIVEENVDNQRNAVKEEKAMRYDNAPYIKAMQTFFNEVWQGTGYGHMAIGTEADLDAAKTEDFRAFFERYYVPNNMVMVIVGDVEFEEVRSKVEKYFGELEAGEPREPFAEIPHEQVKLERVIEDKIAQQPMYMFGWKTVPETHPDRPALELLMNVLLRGDSSRITRILKDEKKLVVASVPLPSMVSGGKDAGSTMAAFVPVQSTKFEDIQKVVWDEIGTVKKRGITRKELEKAINQSTVDTISSLSTNNGRAMMIAAGALQHDDPLYVLSDLEAYQKVTTRDIKRVANEYLTEDWLVLQIVPAGQKPAPAAANAPAGAKKEAPATPAKSASKPGAKTSEKASGKNE